MNITLAVTENAVEYYLAQGFVFFVVGIVLLAGIAIIAFVFVANEVDRLKALITSRDDEIAGEKILAAQLVDLYQEFYFVLSELQDATAPRHSANRQDLFARASAIGKSEGISRCLIDVMARWQKLTGQNGEPRTIGPSEGNDQ